jgi:cell division protein FtsZ
MRDNHPSGKKAMSNLNISVPDLAEMKPRIVVFGVGGGGCNAVNNMIESNLTGVEFVVANTDAQALAKSPCERKIQMGNALTQGLGAGSRPEIGAGAAEEALSEIVDHLAGSHMAFITAGMGGGTGTGAAPVIAKAAKEQGILTVAVVTKPFHFEGKRRMAIAEKGIENLAKHVDTLIVIPNQNLFRVANEKTSFTAAFAMADQVLYSGVASITELMTKEGLINLDFADVRAVMADMGKAMMGTGEASGESRAVEAAEAAISNPLLDDVSLTGARGVLISIAGGPDLTLYEVDEAANRIREEVDEEANIIVGATIEDELEGTMRVSVVATGLQDEAISAAVRQEGTARAEELPRVYGPGGLSGTSYNDLAPQEPVAPPVQGPSVQGAGAGTPEAAVRTEVAEPARANVTSGSEEQDPAGESGAPHMIAEAPVAEGTAEPARAEASGAGGETGAAATGAVKASRPHSPAPKAPPVPDVNELPENMRRIAEEKARRISSAAQDGARKDRRSLLDRLARLGFGMTRRENAVTPPHEEPHLEKGADNVTPLRAAERRDAPASALSAPVSQPEAAAEEDDLSIPTFLRRQEN